MKITWREVALPDFGEIEDRPELPTELYEARCERAYVAAGCDWLVVYGDREHYANLTYLVGFDPRFEEALLLLGAGNRRVLIVGNEGLSYASLVKPRVDLALCQSLSLPGQDRGVAPRLDAVLRDAGLRAGQSIGLVGWKYLTASEWAGTLPGFFAPAMLVDTLRHLAGDPMAVREATPVLLDPVAGLRATAEVEQIAAFEWAAARATAAVSRIVRGMEVGLSELAAVGKMGYEGDPLSAHVLFASGTEPIVGLRSPGTRRIARGDAVTSAIGYWGGLCARAGLVDDDNRAYLESIAIPYYRGVVTWYEAIGVGATGGEIQDRVVEALAEGGLSPALNPGHLTGFDEWVHSPVFPGSEARIASGMPFQCDIIPVPMPPGRAVNCEDPVVFADEALRLALRQRFPATWGRIAARQAFMRDQLGIGIGDDLLPLSTTPAYLAPLWLAPGKALVVE